MLSAKIVPTACLVLTLLRPPVVAGEDAPPIRSSAIEAEANYTRDIEKRADDILAVLGLEDAARAGRVRRAVIAEYRGLRAIQDVRDVMAESLRDAAGSDKERAESLIRKNRDDAEKLAASFNDQFVATLSRDLTPDQVEQVKDKMTYNKLRVTYDGYLEMLPQLDDAQKRYIRDALVQARDRAVYAGSAREKSEVFDKFKGRINNYLSAQGYDLKKASAEWAERRRRAK